MRATKGLSVEQLAKALSHLSPSESKSLLELMDKENLKRRLTLVRRQVAKGKVVSEQALFKSLR
jgi:chromosome segregation and condensation protein ScpB